GRGGRNGDGQPENIGAWLHIAPNGTVTAFTGKAEMGQNIRTSLTQAVADELRCAPSLVRMTMADTALTPYDMGTFGSRTTPTMAPQLRRMAAAARETLIGLAAHQWGVEASALTVTDGHVRDAASGRSAGFGELAGKADLVRAVAADVRRRRLRRGMPPVSRSARLRRGTWSAGGIATLPTSSGREWSTVACCVPLRFRRSSCRRTPRP